MSLLNPFVCCLALMASVPSLLPGAPAPAAAAPRACDSAYLGVYVLSADEGGVTVSSVMPGSPAAEIGLQPGDRLVGIDGEELGGADSLTAAIGSHQAGDEVKLLFHRGDEHKSVRVRLGNRADAEAAGHFGSAPVASAGASAEQDYYQQGLPAQPGWESFNFGGAGAGFEHGNDFSTGFPFAGAQGSDDLEQRLDDLRRRMDERFADLTARMEALRAEHPEGAHQERMSRFQAELDAERDEQARRADELRATLRARAAQHGAQGHRQPNTPFAAWGAFQPGAAAASPEEVQSLRDEVRQLREEIRSLKELLTR